MSDQILAHFITFLEERAAQVRVLEIEATKALDGPEGQKYFAKHMHAKAKLLATLSRDSQLLLADMPEEQASPLLREIEVFTAGAFNALSIGSVFYMYALLYPEDHKSGEPNNLELFISKLRIS